MGREGAVFVSCLPAKIQQVAVVTYLDSGQGQKRKVQHRLTETLLLAPPPVSSGPGFPASS